MKVFNKIVKFVDRITDYGILVFFICFMLMGLYSVYDSYMLYAQADDNSILKFKPGYESDDAGDVDKELTDGYVAWLSIDDTTVDYPVMQGIDNSEFLNKDPFGDYSLAGSIFLDFRNKPDFTDAYSLIYGHHMERGLMFGALDEYRKAGYLEKHTTGTLIVDDGLTYKIRFFAVLETHATNESIFSPTEYDDETLPFVLENNMYLVEENVPKEGEQLIALSTCRFPDTVQRTVVFGVLVPPQDISDSGIQKPIQKRVTGNGVNRKMQF